MLAAINAAVVSGVQAFHDRLRACRPPETQGRGGEEEPARPPLFRVRPQGTYASLLRARAPVHPSPALPPALAPAVPPQVQVSLSLMQGEVVVVPSMQEAGRQLGRALRSIVESARPLVRWMDGTCLEAPPQ